MPLLSGFLRRRRQAQYIGPDGRQVSEYSLFGDYLTLTIREAPATGPVPNQALVARDLEANRVPPVAREPLRSYSPYRSGFSNPVGTRVSPRTTLSAGRAHHEPPPPGLNQAYYEGYRADDSVELTRPEMAHLREPAATSSLARHGIYLSDSQAGRLLVPFNPDLEPAPSEPENSDAGQAFYLTRRPRGEAEVTRWMQDGSPESLRRIQNVVSRVQARSYTLDPSPGPFARGSSSDGTGRASSNSSSQGSGRRAALGGLLGQAISETMTRYPGSRDDFEAPRHTPTLSLARGDDVPVSPRTRLSPLAGGDLATQSRIRMRSSLYSEPDAVPRPLRPGPPDETLAPGFDRTESNATPPGDRQWPGTLTWKNSPARAVVVRRGVRMRSMVGELGQVTTPQPLGRSGDLPEVQYPKPLRLAAANVATLFGQWGAREDQQMAQSDGYGASVRRWQLRHLPEDESDNNDEYGDDETLRSAPRTSISRQQQRAVRNSHYHFEEVDSSPSSEETVGGGRQQIANGQDGWRRYNLESPAPSASREPPLEALALASASSSTSSLLDLGPWPLQSEAARVLVRRITRFLSLPPTTSPKDLELRLLASPSILRQLSLGRVARPDLRIPNDAYTFPAEIRYSYASRMDCYVTLDAIRQITWAPDVQAFVDLAAAYEHYPRLASLMKIQNRDQEVHSAEADELRRGLAAYMHPHLLKDIPRLKQLTHYGLLPLLIRGLKKGTLQKTDVLDTTVFAKLGYDLSEMPLMAVRPKDVKRRAVGPSPLRQELTL